MARLPKKLLSPPAGNRPDAASPGAGQPPGTGDPRKQKAPAEAKGRSMRRKTGPSPGGAAREPQPGVPGVGKVPPTGSRPPRPPWRAVFASEAEYNRSVASVVARIRSGQVRARTPDE